MCPESSSSSERTSSILEETEELNIEVLLGRAAFRLLKAIAILGTLVFLASILRILDNGWHLIYLFHAAILMVIYLTFGLRYRLEKRSIFRVLNLCIFAIGVLGLAGFGLMSGGMLALFTYCLFTGLIYGWKWGGVATGMSLLA